MKLPVSQLVEGENVLQYSTSREEWVKGLVRRISEKGYQLPDGLDIHIRLTKLEPDYYLEGRVKFTCGQPCARCAESFTQQYDYPFELALSHVSAHKAPAKQEEVEELDINYFKGNEIDLEPIVEEQFFLSIPFKVICRPDCRGLCQGCGRNLNNEECACVADYSASPFSKLKDLKVKH